MIHNNSRKALASEKRNLSRRENEILGALLGLGEGTDREIKDILGYSDMNSVRPRISELRDKGFITEIKNKKDSISGKMVRVLAIVPRSNQPQEQGSFGFFDDINLHWGNS